MTLEPAGPWLVLHVPGKPVPWGVQVINRGRHAGLKLQPPSRAYQRAVAVAAWGALQARGGVQLDGPVEVDVVAVLARVKRLRAPGRHLAPVAPDADRVLRNVLDGLHQYGPTGRKQAHAGVIWDDSRVVRAEVATLYADDGEQPATHIRVRPVQGSAWRWWHDWSKGAE